MSEIHRREALFQIGTGLGALTYGVDALASPLPAGRVTNDGRSEGAWHNLHLASARYLTLPIVLNGVPFKALIDSGSTRSVIRHNLALDLNLPYLGTNSALTFTKNIVGTLYRVSDIQVDVAEIRDVDVASYDISGLETLTSREIPVVLGQDVLQDVDIQIDFAGDRARFLSKHVKREWPDFFRQGLQGVDETFPSMPLLFEGRVHGETIIDLGNNVPLSMSAAFATDHGFLKNRKVSTTMTAGVEGVSVNKVFCMQDTRLGPFRLQEVPVCVVEDWQLNQPVSMGWPLLAPFDVVFSLSRNSLRLKGDDQKLSSAFPKDRSGLGAQRWPDRIMVRHVALDSPAWKAGLRTSDYIIAIDGRRIDPNYPPPGERLGLKAAGTKIDMKLADGRDMTMTLADYF